MKTYLRKKNNKWKCTVCGATGKRWQSSWRANRSGRQHINKFHNGKGKLLILKKDRKTKKQPKKTLKRPSYNSKLIDKAKVYKT